MPAEPKNTEQAGRDRRGLRNDRASQLDVVELGVSKARASSRSPGKEESKRKVWRVVSPTRDSETLNLWSTIGWNCGGPESGPRIAPIGTVLNRHAVETTGDALDGEAQCHVLIEPLRRGNIKVEVAVVIVGGIGERHIQVWTAVFGRVYVTRRPIQARAGVIGHVLTAVVIGSDRRKHHSAAGIKIRGTSNIGHKVWQAPTKRIFKIKINYEICLGGRR